MGNSSARAWKQDAQTIVEQLGRAHSEAQGFEEDITQALQVGSNHAVSKKHAINAGKWASKLDQKKSQVIKMNGLATHAKEEIFDKESNKFSDCLEKARSLLEEWEHGDNKGLLHKLLCI